jgi:hypothetical protein
MSSLPRAEHLPIEDGIVKIGRHAHLEAITAECATDNGCLFEIHTGRSPRRNQPDKGAATFGDDNPLTAPGRSGSFGKGRFGFAYREFRETSHVRQGTYPTR